ncbi:MAG: tetratricopeptide repeat protein [Promethearchaeota archaeon]
MSLPSNFDDFAQMSIFSRDYQYTFLVGAGVSMNPPSKIPSAVQFVKTILNLCAPPEEIETILKLPYLRYELLIEKFKIYFDPKLHFLDYLELVKQPNLIHFFLASAMIEKSFVVTTNFDFLIEEALRKILLPTEEYKINPIITREDYDRDHNPYDMMEQGLFPIYKIHGSKKNIITGKDTTGSLVTTMGSLGKDRGIGETFALEGFKQQSFYNIIKGRSLIVMGYSGNDDFDIGPILKTLPRIEQLIWIEHSFEPGFSIEKIENLPEYAPDNIRKSTKLLHEIYSKIKIPIYQIFADTQDFVKSILWPLILPEFPLIKSEFLPIGEVIPFQKWVSQEFQDALPKNIQKYEFSCSIYGNFKLWKDLERSAEVGISLAKQSSDLRAHMRFINYLGKAQMAQYNSYTALEHFQEGIQIAGESNDLEYMATFINNVGVISNRLRYVMDPTHLKATFEMFENALSIFEEHQNEWGKITCLNNLAAMDFWKGEYLEANKSLAESYTSIQHLGNLNYKATISYNIAMVCEFMMTEKDVIEKYGEGIDINHLMGNKLGMINGYWRLLQYWYFKKDYKNALKNLEEAFNQAQEQNMIQIIADLYIMKGWIQYRTLSCEEALMSLTSALDTYQQYKDIDLALIWQVQVLSDIAYMHYNANAPDRAKNTWMNAKSLLEKISIPSAYALLLLDQLKENIEIVSNSTNPEKINKDNLETYISEFTREIESVDKKIEHITNALTKGLPIKMGNTSDGSDPFREVIDLTGTLWFDLGYLRLYEHNNQLALHSFENALDYCSRIENYSQIRKHLGNLSKLKIISKTVRAFRESYYFLTQDEQDIAQEDTAWIASWRSRSKSKVAFQYLEEGSRLFDEEQYLESTKIFLQALELFKRLGEKGQVKEIRGILSSVIAMVIAQGDAIVEMANSDPVQKQEIMEILRAARVEVNLAAEEEIPTVEEILESKQENLLKGVFNRDLLISTEFLNQIKDSGRMDQFQKDHNDDFYSSMSKVSTALMFSENMGAEGPKGLIPVLILAGQILYSNQEFEMAEQRLLEAFHISVVYGAEAKEEQADILMNLGILYYQQQDYDHALLYLEQSMRLFENTDHHTEYAKTLLYLGIIHQALSNPARSYFYLREAEFLPISKDNAEVIVECFVRAAEQCESIGNYLIAFDLLKRSITIIEEYQFTTIVAAKAYFMAGFLYNLTDQNEKVVKSYERALELFTINKNQKYMELLPPKIEIFKNNALTIEKTAMYNYAEAEKLWNSDAPLDTTMISYKKAMIPAEHSTSKELLAKCHYKIATLYLLDLKPFSMIPHYEKVQAILKDIDFGEEIKEILEESQTNARLVDTPEKFISFFEEAAESELKEKNYGVAAGILEQLCHIYGVNGNLAKIGASQLKLAKIYFTSMNRKPDGIILYHDCESIFEELSQKDSLLSVWLDMLVIDYEKKNYDKAFDYALKSLKYYQKKDDFEQIYLMNNYLGDIEFKNKKFESGLQYFLGANASAEKLKDAKKQLNISFYLGLGFSNIGKVEEARKSYQSGIDLALLHQIRTPLTGLCINLGGLYFLQGNFQKGEEYSRLAITYLEASPNDLYLAITLSVLAPCLYKQQKFTESLSTSKKSLEIFQKLNDNIQIKIAQIRIEKCLYHLPNLQSDSQQMQKVKMEIENIEDSEDKAMLFEEFASYSNVTKNFEDTKNYYSKAIELCRKYPDRTLLGTLLYDLGIFEYEQGNFKESKDLLQEAYEIYKDFQNPERIKRIESILE